MQNLRSALCVVVVECLAFASCAHAQDRTLSPERAASAARLIAAYPDQLDRLDDAMLAFKDGTRLVFDDGRGAKSFDEMLAHADIKDQLAQPYPAGAAAAPPPANFDPGRFRNAAFFKKIYGDCAKGQVAAHLVSIDWLPNKKGGQLKVTSINGVAENLKAVSAELDALPPSFDRFLVPSAGTYNCRDVAGTKQPSMHAYGAAIDINVRQSDYWRWSKPGRGGAIPYRNRVPREIVSIFERHGFIWGGKWYHYDTMHFEYRPELITPQPAQPQR